MKILASGDVTWAIDHPGTELSRSGLKIYIYSVRIEL